MLSVTAERYWLAKRFGNADPQVSTALAQIVETEGGDYNGD